VAAHFDGQDVPQLLRIRTGSAIHCQQSKHCKGTFVDGSTYTLTEFKNDGELVLSRTGKFHTVLQSIRGGYQSLNGQRIDRVAQDSQVEKILVGNIKCPGHLHLPKKYTDDKAKRLQSRVHAELGTLSSVFESKLKEEGLSLEDMQRLSADKRSTLSETLFEKNIKMIIKLENVDWSKDGMVTYPFEGLFEREGIRGRELVHLTVEALAGMGVRTLGEQHQLLHSINRLLVQTLQDEITLSVNWLMCVRYILRLPPPHLCLSLHLTSAALPPYDLSGTTKACGLCVICELLKLTFGPSV
jgi:hypothetical protein